MDPRFWLILLLAPAAALFSTPSLASDAVGYCGTPYDKAVTTEYPIRGTWMYARSACGWQTSLQDFHRMGGTTVLNFGPHLKRHTDPSTVAIGCTTAEGTSCVQQARQEIGTGRIRNWLSYEFNEHYGSAIACPGGFDRKIETVVDGVPRVFWRIVLPHDGQAACDYSSGSFDVLFVQYDANAIESTTAMLTVADHLGMEVYLGAPAFPVVTGQEWQIDAAMLSSHRDWARRVYADWATRHAGHSSFRGAYQSYEVLLGSTYTASDTEYGQDAGLFRNLNPGRKYAISPYLFLLKDGRGNTQTVEQTVSGFRRLATAGVDIIAPQDGRGTGNAAYYWPGQATQLVGAVDPRLGLYPRVDASRSFSSQYGGSIRDVFNALGEAKSEFNQGNRRVELWANIEAFEEDTESPDYAGCSYISLSRTTKERMDRALTFVAGRVDKVISFMYDPLFTCTDRFGLPLHQAIAADHDRPVITDAFFWDAPSTGMVVNGHGIGAGTELQITWYDSNWQLQTQRLSPGWIYPGGAGAGLDSIWIPFQRSDLAPGFFIYIGAVKSTQSGTKSTTENFSLGY
ncbi:MULTISPECIES: DUF4434 domain-containing protein [Stenotrophomonas maltophilia group]|uniref:DUF4434 domain-containing protein n=2 Tax=Gammaproteobacteria TaxID=1236 RepID=UPI00066A1C5C|nr:DUF4434 domain-containing protein [Stenotrophomonas maltophilia]MBH1409082.1 DUF4434 domain-containing protein [Stenotrophomonas maltophilia]MBH1678567.1 DUF4434 domain-containing protein [Stenotrophomonas maltophilia]MDZ5778380.1 DUF4434 domain-containing protein [Stenotrophomonas maltophilia]NUH63311.1 DUF4434 domain-containing protein [Stenotrophomonas maltophilia]HDS1301584.1 DUF4434 domain-containing protein [Stenotrophomonas maltophilia]